MAASEPRYTIVLETIPDESNRTQVRDLLTADLGIEPGRAAAILSSLPAPVVEQATEVDAVRTKQKLEWSGAEVSIRLITDSPPPPAAAPAEETPAPPPDESGPLPSVQDELEKLEDEPGPDEAHEKETPPPTTLPPRPPEPPPAQGRIASPGETRVERLKKTLHSARQIDRQPQPLPPNMRFRSHRRSSAKSAFTVVLLLLVGVFLVAYLKRPSERELMASRAQQQTLAQYQRWYQLGAQRMQGGKYQEAIVAFQNALEHIRTGEAAAGLKDARYRMRNNAGEEAEAEGKLAEALQAYEQADQIKSTEESRKAVERVYQELTRRRVAAHSAALIEEVSKKVALLEAQKDWRGVVEILEQLKDKAGESQDIKRRLEMARLKVLEGSLTEQQQRVRHSHRQKLRGYIQEARQLLQAGKPRQAEQTIGYALTLDPDHEEALAIRRACRSQTAAEAKSGAKLEPNLHVGPPPRRPRLGAGSGLSATQAMELLEAELRKAEAARRALSATPGQPASIVKPAPRPSAVPRPPEPAPRPAPRPTPPRPRKPARAKAFWPHARGDTWRYRSDPSNEVVRYTSKNSTITQDGLPCVEYEVVTFGPDGAFKGTSSLTLQLQSESLSRVLGPGNVVKQYELPLTVGWSFSYQIPGRAGEQVVEQPTKVMVTTERRETITTPAGWFDCFVIKTIVQQKRFFAQTAEISQREETRMDWVTAGVGLIKRESVVTEAMVGKPGSKQTQRSSLELIEYTVQTD